MAEIPKTSRVGRSNGRNKSSGKSSSNSKNGYKNMNEAGEDVDDSQQCVICAEQIVYASFTPCNHKTCHKCSLRQRALYEKDLCLVCRTPNDSVIISNDSDKEYKDFDNSDLSIYNEKFKIYFTSQLISDKCLELMEFRCSVKGCVEKFDNFKDLQEHTKLAHNKYFCLICYNNKKAFIPELALYHYKSLQTHQTVGDSNGFLGHPACKHCIKKRFYSEDELNIHIRDNHERCHICDQDHPATADYYKNYDELYNHFKYDHYVCTIQSCLDKKFVVFREDLDLTAHMLKEHGSLTGSNKIVIGSGGASGRSFQSQLSTYQSNTRRNNSAGTEEPDSYNLKKMRFEERAKHYLHNDNDKMKQFLEINNSFKSSKISGEETANAYKKLFVDQNSEEILILLTEFAELFPDSASKQKSLNDSIQIISKTAKDTNFPILGGRAQSPTVNLHGWGSGSSSKSSSVDKFPVLGRPSNDVPKVQANQKIRYTTIVKHQPKAKPVISQQSNPHFRPSYLEPKQPSSSSLASSGSSSSSLSSMNSKSGSNDVKFPPLEKKTIKKSFPRVNPVLVPSPLQWGASGVQAPPKNNEDDWGTILVKDKRKNKKNQ